MTPQTKATASTESWWQHYRFRVHWAFVVVVAAVTVILGLIGWHLRPTSEPPSPPDPGMEFTIGFTGSQADQLGDPRTGPRLQLNETLAVGTKGRPTHFDLAMSSRAVEPLPVNGPVHWFMSVRSTSEQPRRADIFPYACSIDSKGNFENLRLYPGESPAAQGLQEVRVLSAEQAGSAFPEKDFYGVASDPTVSFANLSLCWHASPPGQVTGAYMTALFPQTSVAGKTVVNQYLQIGPAMSNALVGWTQQSGNPASDITAGQWAWRPVLIAGMTDSNLIYATNVSSLQRETSNGFISGILLGIAGAGLFIVMQELVLSAYRRKQA